MPAQQGPLSELMNNDRNDCYEVGNKSHPASDQITHEEKKHMIDGIVTVYDFYKHARCRDELKLAKISSLIEMIFDINHC